MKKLIVGILMVLASLLSMFLLLFWAFVRSLRYAFPGAVYLILGIVLLLFFMGFAELITIEIYYE